MLSNCQGISKSVRECQRVRVSVCGESREQCKKEIGKGSYVSKRGKDLVCVGSREGWRK